MTCRCLVKSLRDAGAGVAEPVAPAAVQEPRRRTETYSSELLIPGSGFVFPFGFQVQSSTFEVREPRTQNLEPEPRTRTWNMEPGTAMFKVWRKRLGVEPNLPAKRGATGFEDRGGHRAPFASVCR